MLTLFFISFYRAIQLRFELFNKNYLHVITDGYQRDKWIHNQTAFNNSSEPNISE